MITKSILTTILFLILITPTFAIETTTNNEIRDGNYYLKNKALTRLTDAKLKACQAKEDSLTKRSTQLKNLATNMQEKFDKTAEKIKEYYTSKVLPSGKTVSNYDSLVADIQSKKEAVKTAVDKSIIDINGFTCDGEDPKGQMTLFRDDMKSVKSALQDYRTSIKNLIVAVRSAK